MAGLYYGEVTAKTNERMLALAAKSRVDLGARRRHRVSSKEKLIEALKSSKHDLLDRLETVTPEQFEEGAYEGGWNRRQILAHVASVEWAYPRLIAMARDNLPWPELEGTTDLRGADEPYR